MKLSAVLILLSSLTITQGVYAQCAGCDADTNRNDRMRTEGYSEGYKQGYEQGKEQGRESQQLEDKMQEAIKGWGEIGEGAVKGAK